MRNMGMEVKEMFLVTSLDLISNEGYFKFLMHIIQTAFFSICKVIVNVCFKVSNTSS